jgi:hypothetical protein
MGKPELALYAKADGTGRAYRHPFRTLEDGSPVTSPSVTTILNLVDKPALIQWAADQTLDWAINNASLLFVKDQEGARRWGRYRWQDVRDERAEVGTGIHETVESLHTGGWTFPVLDDEQKRIMDQWYLLNERYEITPHRSEFTVWGGLDQGDLHWAGTCDGLWDLTDRETGEMWSNLFIDLKTSKNTWPEHWLQLSALRNGNVIMVKNPDGTWIEEDLPIGDGTAIIHLRADKYKVTVESDYDLINLQYNQFMGYRSVWKYKKEVEQFVTNRDKTATLAF